MEGWHTLSHACSIWRTMGWIVVLCLDCCLEADIVIGGYTFFFLRWFNQVSVPIGFQSIAQDFKFCWIYFWLMLQSALCIWLITLMLPQILHAPFLLFPFFLIMLMVRPTWDNDLWSARPGTVQEILWSWGGGELLGYGTDDIIP